MIGDVMEGVQVGTLFHAQASPLENRKRWIFGAPPAGEITVDELAIKVKRAAELIKVCKNKLTSTEEDVNLILKELEN